MRIKHIGAFAALAAALVLAGCGEEQAAQNQAPPPSPAQPGPAPQIAQPAPPPAGTQTAPVAPLQAPGGQPQQPTASPPPTLATPGAANDAASPPAPATTGSTNQTAAVGADAGSSFRAIVGRDFTGGPVTLRLDQGDRFTMRDQQGRSVAGRYTYENGILTLRDPEGDARGAQFPMRCRFEPEAEGRFRLGASDGSCPYFRDVVFSAAS